MIFTSPEQSAELRGLPASGPLTGHGGADYRVRENVVNNLNNAFEGISPIKKTGTEAAAGRPSGRRQPSLLGVWGHQPPSVINFFNRNSIS